VRNDIGCELIVLDEIIATLESGAPQQPAVPEIVTFERMDGWIAHLASNTRVWFSGQTEEEAVGKLIVTLRRPSSSAQKQEDALLFLPAAVRITGKDLHGMFLTHDPSGCMWEEVPATALIAYNTIAREINGGFLAPLQGLLREYVRFCEFAQPTLKHNRLQWEAERDALATRAEALAGKE
jgi:hypothetical protein